MRTHEVDQQNVATYGRAPVVRAYAEDRWLPVEVMIYARYLAAHTGARILDLACGTGRLANVLAQTGSSYLGVDYSAAMLNEFMVRHPGLACTEADLRTFRSRIQDKFEIVWLSFNGIDSIPFNDREFVFNGVKEALMPGGYFIFSTHNLGYIDHVDRQIRLPTCCNYCRVKAAIRQFINKTRLGRHEAVHSDYAIVNDRALDFSLLNVYVNSDLELRSIRALGFEILEVREASGKLQESGRALMDTASPWFYFVSRYME